MEEEKIKILLEKYRKGQADSNDLNQLERFIEKGVVDLNELEEELLKDDLSWIKSPSPSEKMDAAFYTMLSKQRRGNTWFNLKDFLTWPQPVMRLAAASLLLLIGFGVGRFYGGDQDNRKDVQLLSQQVTELKEMMMLSLLEKEEATERLKAVSLTSEMDGVSAKVTSALLKTLNNDDNVNVRLAALEALKLYVHQSSIREELVRSIAQQESPLVQVALAELMAALNEKSSVRELDKILKDKKTPDEVKKRIEQSLKVMSKV